MDSAQHKTHPQRTGTNCPRRGRQYIKPREEWLFDNAPCTKGIGKISTFYSNDTKKERTGVVGGGVFYIFFLERSPRNCILCMRWGGPPPGLCVWSIPPRWLCAPEIYCILPARDHHPHPAAPFEYLRCLMQPRLLLYSDMTLDYTHTHLSSLVRRLFSRPPLPLDIVSEYTSILCCVCASSPHTRSRKKEKQREMKRRARLRVRDADWRDRFTYESEREKMSALGQRGANRCTMI
jgi:hypothetical protein